MSRGSAPHATSGRVPGIDLAVAASLWGGLYVISAATFDAIPPATLTLIRLAIGVAVLLLYARMRGVGVGWSEATRAKDSASKSPPIHSFIALCSGCFRFLRILRRSA